MDGNLQRKIVKALDVGPEDDVLEIGPGRGALTRHLVGRSGDVRTLELPRGPGDLYYTAVLREGRVCATRCGDLAVVCRDADG